MLNAPADNNNKPTINDVKVNTVRIDDDNDDVKQNNDVNGDVMVDTN